MLKVLVFEDNIDELNTLQKYAKNFFDARNISYHIDYKSTFPDDLSCLSNYDIVFLDIRLGNQNGIFFGQKLTEVYPGIVTIITSKYSQYLIEGYKINARRYFLKPYTQELFNIEMDDVLSSNFFKQHYGFYDEQIAPYKIHYRDILYVEYSFHKSIIHFINDDMISCYYPLRYWIAKLSNKGFSQPYRSLIVNLSYIENFSNNENNIIMSNGDNIPISKHYKKQFFLEYMEYLHSAI